DGLQRGDGQAKRRDAGRPEFALREAIEHFAFRCSCRRRATIAVSLADARHDNHLPNSADGARRDSGPPTITALGFPPWSSTTVHDWFVWMNSAPELAGDGA